MTAPLQLTEALAEDRFSRLRLISWWEQKKIESLRVLVVGCGALGNEILKNLALLGVHQFVVADPDKVEISNLSRSVLFRPGDLGKPKAHAGSEGVRELFPECQAQPLGINVVQELGLGVVMWADVIIGGVDNREARLWMNRSAWKLRKSWIDGAIEGINGVARVFVAGQPPCYECTLGETDWALLERRMSCNLLLRDPAPEGKVPTTPTISSIIAAIQVQEAVKLAHGMPTLAGKGYIFEGLNHTSYVVEYTENPECQSHYSLPVVLEVNSRSEQLTLHSLWKHACAELGSDAVIEFSRDVISRLTCPGCNEAEVMFVPVGRVAYDRGFCPKDGKMRIVETVHSYSGNEWYGERKLSELGLPLFDVYTARAGEQEIGLLIAGDRNLVLSRLTAEVDS